MQVSTRASHLRQNGHLESHRCQETQSLSEQFENPDRTTLYGASEKKRKKGKMCQQTERTNTAGINSLLSHLTFSSDAVVLATGQADDL